MNDVYELVSFWFAMLSIIASSFLLGFIFGYIHARVSRQ